MSSKIIKLIKKISRIIINFGIYIINKIFGKKKCPVCDNKIIRYKHIPMEYIDELYRRSFVHSLFVFETFNITDYSCPICSSNDSTRLYSLYLREKLDKERKNIKLLDIAPTKQLIKLIKSYSNIDYRSADLYMEDVDDKVDVVDMKIYSDNSFDFIICTHVLEHVELDNIAMSEIYRILKPGGECIVQVPILTNIHKDYEKDFVTSVEDRWKYFGDSTHVRLYSSSGFVNKLKKTGFTVELLGVDYFGKDLFIKNNITDSSVLYIVKK